MPATVNVEDAELLHFYIKSMRWLFSPGRVRGETFGKVIGSRTKRESRGIADGCPGGLPERLPGNGSGTGGVEKFGLLSVSDQS